MTGACPTPSKKAYDTIEAAVWFARADGLRAYACRCGKFHLTSSQRAGKPMGVARKRRA